METRKETKETKNTINFYLLLITVAGIGFNLYYKYDRHYLGEPLVTKKVIIEYPPIYRGGSSRTTAKYSLKGSNYRCRFWLSEGAFHVIRSDNQIKRAIESVNIGDTIQVKIRQADELKLQDSTAHPRIIELIAGAKTIIKSSAVEKYDRRSFYINISIPILSFIIWLIIKVRERGKK